MIFSYLKFLYAIGPPFVNPNAAAIVWCKNPWDLELRQVGLSGWKTGFIPMKKGNDRIAFFPITCPEQESNLHILADTRF